MNCRQNAASVISSPSGQTTAEDNALTFSTGNSNCVTVSIAATAVNDAPTAATDGYGATTGIVLIVNAPGVLANDTDVDSASLTAIKVTDPGHGSLTLNANGGFSYQATGGFTGSDSF